MYVCVVCMCDEGAVCVVVWSSGCVVVWLHGCVVVRGCVVVWLCVCLCGCVVVYVRLGDCELHPGSASEEVPPAGIRIFIS